MSGHLLRLQRTGRFLPIHSSADPYHVAFQDSFGIADQIQPPLVRNVSGLAGLDVISAAIEAVLSALAYHWITPVTVREGQAGAPGLDWGRPEYQVDAEVAGDIFQKGNHVFELLEDPLCGG